MEDNSLQLQITLLKHQIELEETNLKYAVELQKDYSVLKRIRDDIVILRDKLSELSVNDKQENEVL